MPYYLAPYVGAGTSLDPFRPRGSEQPGWSAIDLRPDGAVANGRCLLYLPVHDPDPLLVPLAYAPLDLLSPQRRAALGNLLGLTLVQVRWREIVAELLTLHAREDGTRWKPLREMVNGRMRLYLGGLLHEWLPGSVGPAISENWNCANSTSLTCQLTWTETLGTQWGIVTNAAELSGAGGDNSARAEADLATANNECQATMVQVATNGEGRVACRFSAAVNTYYWYGANGSSAQSRLFKAVDGLFTSLSVGGPAPVNGDVYRVRADGSSITGAINGTTQNSATDTEITGNLRAGIGGDTAGGTPAVRMDTWSAADLAAAGVVSPRLFGLLGVGT